jgi:hypothetical protein
MKPKPGDMARIKCVNSRLHGKVGTVILNKPSPPHSFIYTVCVLINGRVYGFEEDEVEVISEDR